MGSVKCTFVLGIILCVLAFCSGANRAYGASFVLFEEAPEQMDGAAAARASGAFKALPFIRLHPVILNPVIGDSYGLGEGDYLTFSLFDDTVYTAKVDRVGTNVNGTVTVRARIDGYSLGHLIITTTESQTLGIIHIPETYERYHIQMDTHTGIHYLLELNIDELEELEDGPPLIPPSVKERETDDGVRLSDVGEAGPLDPAAIDVMVFYTPAARQWANTSGGGINNVIAQAVANGQFSLDNSNTIVTVTLVHSAPVSYAESGDSSTDLYRLTNTSDGHMDSVHTLRDEKGADFVGLFTSVDDVGGIGWLLTTVSGDPSHAFSITRVQQAGWGYTYIHEMGHNMGCHHAIDQETQPGPGLFSYSAGWNWIGNDNGKYCSVMSYGEGGYDRVGYFSNPSILYQGVPTGHAVYGDNARTIREIKHTVAAYREGAIPLTVTSPAGGSWWELGEDLPIRWDYERYSGDFEIELYKGGLFERLIDPCTRDNESYVWPIGTDGDLTGGDDYQIKVTAVSNPLSFDYSSNFGIATPPEAQDSTAGTEVGMPVMITLAAVDEGRPDPPGALTYTIMSLPMHGDLEDPYDGEITSVPYTLTDNGNQVRYVPDPDYDDKDSFTFKVSDGGVGPGGGDSETATVLIKIGVIYFANMDYDGGWSGSGSWEWGTPSGKGGSSYGNPDPDSGYIGSNVWGINLNGDYRTGVGGPYYLTTQAIDFSEYGDIRLRFCRWLNCDYQPYVHETVEVSNDGSTWTLAWENGGPPAITDDSWQTVEYDISSVADNQPTVFIRWGHRVARASACGYSGWNIDEVEVVGKRSDILVVDFGLDELWMYQNVAEQSKSDLTASVSITDDPMGNSSYSYAWEILLPGDVDLAPVTVDGGGAGDAYWRFAARGCDEPGGLSDSGQTFTVRVTVTGDDYGNTGQAEAEFGIALLGDINNDGVVNVVDRSIANVFWRTGSGGPYTLRDCDVNCDGIVSVVDRSIVNAVWRGMTGQNSVSNPCPMR